MTEAELLKKHRNLVKIISQSFKSSDLTEQDLFQEGLIALSKAVKTFDKNQNIKFETYASRVIKNRLIDVTRHGKANPENRRQAEARLSGEQVTTGHTTEDLWDIIEKSKEIKTVLERECTQIERAIFNSHARGHSYEEIKAIFGISHKKIDNTVQKVRNKIRKHIKNE